MARFLWATNTAVQAAAISEWVWDHARDRIVAFLEEPKTLDELRAAVRPGFEIHHIVEQTPARQDGFPSSRISARENLVRIPTYGHWEITGWYATKSKDFGGLSPREFLRGQRWEVRVAVGLKALRDHEVLE